jgi:hypothetical protein
MSPTTLMLTALRRRATVPLLALLMVALSGGCSHSTAVERELAAAKHRWAQTAPPAYQVTIVLSCFCVNEITRPVVVAVRQGQVESRRYVDTGAEVDARYAFAFPTIDGLFALIEDAVARNAARVEATYDGARGFPVTIAIDYSATHVDDELFYGTRDFGIP